MAAFVTTVAFAILGLSAGYNWNHWNAAAPKFPFQDPTLSWDKRTDDLVSRLTLDEIVPQTLAVYGGYTPAIDRLSIKPYVWITECLHGQTNTNATAFPQAIGLSSSFSRDLIFRIAEAISYEVRAHWNFNSAQGKYETFNGLSCFSPVINIMRHPLWGRNQETYGEDPFLTGSLVQQYVKGLQGSHPRYVRANAGCKHFDVHGGPENIPIERYAFDAKVNMRDWRMTFLPAFKMCVEAGTFSLMCSYNSVNGIPACAHKQLLTDITRTEWGFTGYIVSDAGAISNIISYHKYLQNDTQVSAACIKAGCNLELGSDVYNSQLDAMKLGMLTEQEIRANVRPLMYTRLRLGEFDPLEMNPYNQINTSVIQSAEHRQLAVEAAMKSFVLLKNDNAFLPLTKKYNKLAVVGPFADDKDQIFGNYPANVMLEYTKSVSEGLQPLADSVQVARGCSDTHCTEYDQASVSNAVEGADLVVVCLGTGSKVEQEANDRTDIDLPGHQLQLLQDAVYFARGAPVLLLLFNAGPLDVTWAKLSPTVPAMLACFFPAQSAGESLYKTLTASAGPDSVPAGRLTATWPSHLTQVPSITDYNMTGHTYRYYDGDPLYSFGYGLSYSSFVYTSVELSSKQLTAGQALNVTVTVINTGTFAADEVVQVYLEWTNASSLPVPRLQLVSFERVRLDAGQLTTVSLLVEAERMRVWGSVGWIYIKGLTTIYAGGQQPNQRTVTGSNVLKGSFVLV